MFYMVSKNDNGVWEENIYRGHSDQFKDEIATMEVETVIDFKIPGKTYSEKQKNLRDLALDYLSAIANTNAKIGLSYGELSDIWNFFEKNGRRYGLYQEFKGECIC